MYFIFLHIFMLDIVLTELIFVSGPYIWLVLCKDIGKLDAYLMRTVHLNVSLLFIFTIM
jgi:hypothetical protein